MLPEELTNLEEDVVSIHTKVIIKTSWGIIICCLGWMGLAFYLDEPVIALLTGPALFGTILAVVLALLEIALAGPKRLERIRYSLGNVSKFHTSLRSQP